MAESGFEDSYQNLLYFIADYLGDKKPNCIAIGFPSVVTGNGHIPVAPNMPGWVNIPLKEYLTRDLSRILDYGINVVIENDANVAAYAEMSIGCVSHINSFLYITLGTGIGGSIVYDRKIMKGSTFSGGEIGHTIIERNNPLDKVASYRSGVFERFASKQAIIDNYRLVSKNERDSTEENIDVKEIFDRSLANEKAALEVVSTYIKDMSVGIASAINLLGIPCIVLGGGISNSLFEYKERLENEITERLLPGNRSQFELKKAYFQRDSGLIGSAIMAKDYEESNK
jgi:glucokinase